MDDRVLNTFKSISSTAKSPFVTRNYMFKVNNRNTRTRSEITLKLTTKTPEGSCCIVSNFKFEQASADWAQPTVAFSNLTVETLEQGVKYIQS